MATTQAGVCPAINNHQTAISGFWFEKVWLAPMLALLAYLPYLWLPPLPDDYLQWDLALRYISREGFADLLNDGLYRCRMTSLLLARLWHEWFGISSSGTTLLSIAIHGLNGCLVYRLATRLKGVSSPVAATAAMIFTLRERHHEAVIWFSALPELLVFCFSLLCLIVWTRWLERRTAGDYASTAVLFLLALASKESGVFLLPAMLLTAGWNQRRFTARDLAALLPFGLAVLGYFVATLTARTGNQHYQDGTFSLAAPFWQTLAASAARGFWFWGAAAILAVFVWGRREHRLLAVVCGAWLLAAMLPYSFLTYMPRIPSRHHYLASPAVALLIAVAAFVIHARFGRRMVWALGIAFALHNVGYIWVFKKPQFEARARPLEALVEFTRHATGPVYVPCAAGTYPFDEASRAVRFRLGPQYTVKALSGETAGKRVFDGGVCR